MIRPKLITALGDPGIYIGEREYLEAGEFEFLVPQAVRRLHVCCVGAGGLYDGQSYYSGGGGALAWANGVKVEPGEKLKIVVGAPWARGGQPGDSAIYRVEEPENEEDDPIETMLVKAGGGVAPQGGQFSFGTNADGSNINGGGGNGGNGAYRTDLTSGGYLYATGLGGGGGAGGYRGFGGKANGGPPQAGSGGGSAGTGYYFNYSGLTNGTFPGREGGGVGIKGQGSDGPSPGIQPAETPARPGNPGSGGDGAKFGGGGGGGNAANAGGGAVRIIWGNKFSYPDNADIEAVE